MGSEVVVSNLKLLKPESSFDMLNLYMPHLLWNYLEQSFQFFSLIFYYVIGGALDFLVG